MLQEKLVERLLCPRVRTARQKVKKLDFWRKKGKSRRNEKGKIKSSGSNKHCQHLWRLWDISSSWQINCWDDLCFFSQAFLWLSFDLSQALPSMCAMHWLLRLWSEYVCKPHPKLTLGNAYDKLWQCLGMLSVCLQSEKSFSGLFNAASVHVWMPSALPQPTGLWCVFLSAHVSTYWRVKMTSCQMQQRKPTGLRTILSDTDTVETSIQWFFVWEKDFSGKSEMLVILSCARVFPCSRRCCASVRLLWSFNCIRGCQTHFVLTFDSYLVSASALQPFDFWYFVMELMYYSITWITGR